MVEPRREAEWFAALREQHQRWETYSKELRDCQAKLETFIELACSAQDAMKERVDTWGKTVEMLWPQLQEVKWLLTQEKERSTGMYRTLYGRTNGDPESDTGGVVGRLRETDRYVGVQKKLLYAVLAVVLPLLIGAVWAWIKQPAVDAEQLRNLNKAVMELQDAQRRQQREPADNWR